MSHEPPTRKTRADLLQAMSYQPRKIETLADLAAMMPGTALEAMHLQLESVDAEHLTVSMPVTAQAKQPAGLLHGGMTVFLMESASSMHACFGVDLRKRAPVGIEVSASHVGAVADGTVRATAKVVRRSHSFLIHTVEVTHVESGRIVSAGRVTNYYVRVGDKETSG